MKKRILIVHPDINMFVAIKDLLDEIRDDGGYEFSWSYARNQREAENKAGPLKVDLVVTSLEISRTTNRRQALVNSRRGLGLFTGCVKQDQGLRQSSLPVRWTQRSLPLRNRSGTSVWSIGVVGRRRVQKGLNQR
jgi:hypothetical protein